MVQKDLAMRLIHYFVLKEKYETIKINGLKDEIWLQNFEEHFKIIRIVSDPIKTKVDVKRDVQKLIILSKKIKKKTISVSLPVLTIYTNFNEDLKLPQMKKNSFIAVKNMDELRKSKLVNLYPKIIKETSFKESGADLFRKITDEINEHSRKEAREMNMKFKKKIPYLTYTFIAINILIYILSIVDAKIVMKYATNYSLVYSFKQYYRLITYAFLHSLNDPFHIIFNMLTLNWVGTAVERYFGKVKFLIIYFYSALMAGLLSIAFQRTGISVGASGAIFGLIGALIYFGYNYRHKISHILLYQMISVVVVNLTYGFLQSNVDNFGHIGGLVGGFLMAFAVGASNKRSVLSVVGGFIAVSAATFFFFILGFAS